jgi:hypothetical protein
LLSIEVALAMRHNGRVGTRLGFYWSEGLIAAVAILIAALTLGLLLWLTSHSPSAPVGRVEAEILTFRPFDKPYSAGMDTQASVRLRNGLVVMLRLPRTPAARDCRAGDRVFLLRRSNRLFFPVEGCRPVNRPPASAPA